MVDRVFESFLENVDEYRACERFWSALVSGVEASLGQSGEWRPWIPRTTPNGTPIELDGDPMIDRRSDRLDRAFRVAQHRAQGDGLEIAAWLKDYGEEYAHPGLPRYELVISLSLSKESSEVALRLLVKWMSPQTAPGEMENAIEAMIPRVED